MKTAKSELKESWSQILGLLVSFELGIVGYIEIANRAVVAHAIIVGCTDKARQVWMHLVRIVGSAEGASTLGVCSGADV